MAPTVDGNLKSDLIMSKHIRQATSKILQRPSQFNGFSFSEHKQFRLNPLEFKLFIMPITSFRNKLETALNHTSSQKPALPEKTKISLKLSEDSFFDKTFSSNIKAQSRLSDYEYAFDKLHNQTNLYEEIDKVCDYQPCQPQR